MCFGKSSSSAPAQQTPPPSPPPTRFDYNAQNNSDAQRRANAAVNTANSATQLSSTMGSFGSELGGAQAAPSTPAST